MPRYTVTLTNDEIQELKALIQKGGKGYRIRHAQILLKLDQKPENKAWTYDRIKDAYGASRTTIAGIAQRFVMEGMEAALGRKVQENRRRKVTGDVEARICAIACSEPPEGASRWTMQAIADELIRLEVVDYITDTTVCEVMKKRNQAVARKASQNNLLHLSPIISNPKMLILPSILIFFSIHISRLPSFNMMFPYFLFLPVVLSSKLVCITIITNM